MTDVWVRRLKLAVRATDAESGVQALRDAEQLLPSVLEQLGAAVGEGVVVLRRVEVRLLVRSLGVPLAASQLERALLSRLLSLVEEARQGTSPSSTAAWYHSEAQAMAAYLGALSRGGEPSWPFSAFRHWGTDLNRVYDRCLTRGALFVADVLTELVSHELGVSRSSSPAGVWLGALSPETAAKLLSALQSGRPALDLADLPEHIGQTIDELVAALPAPLSEAHRELVQLGALFAAWPGARAYSVRWSRAEPRERRSPQREARRSSAGGLVFWEIALQQLNVNVTQSYAPRASKAVRWAVGRTLEAASLPPRDPLLLVFSGEQPGTMPNLEAVLTEADPEPLHALALSLASRLGFLGGDLRIVPLGEEQVLVGPHRIAVDSVVAVDGHDALPLLVRNLARRANSVARAVKVEQTLDAPTLDAIAEVDAAFASSGWTAALRALASVLRAWLQTEFRAELRATRQWRATWREDDIIELYRPHAHRLAAGTWLRQEEVVLHEKRCHVRMV